MISYLLLIVFVALSFLSPITPVVSARGVFNNARIVSVSLPSPLVAGQVAKATIVVKNTGASIWTRNANFRLGSQAPNDNSIWRIGRVELLPNQVVLPGQTATFTFTIVTPGEPGDYSFSWRMLQEFVEWFGQPATISHVTVSEPPTIALPPAPGRYVGSSLDASSANSFSSYDKITMSHLFYWYDSFSKYHLLDADGSDALTDHPTNYPSYTNPDFSLKSVDWWKKELAGMSAAGIDVVLPVYWGFPDSKSSENWWSNGGIINMVKAMDELNANNIKTPRVAMFYDTTTLRLNPLSRKLNLSKDYDREYFYGTMRDYWSLIPPRYWAQIDGKPVVGLYEPFTSAYNQGTFDYVAERFKSDFAGKEPYIITTTSWKNVVTDNTTTWGAAFSGPQIKGVAEIGPGYDDSAVMGRKPSIRLRDDGSFYEGSWYTAMNSGKNIIILETWNEFHEGSDIAESKEYGNKYIIATNRYSSEWRGLDNDATVTNSKISSQVSPVTTVPISITFKNSGTTTWYPEAGYQLGLRTLAGEKDVWQRSKAALDSKTIVKPGETMTVIFDLQAPSTPGIYPLRLQMKQGNDGWFGQSTDNITVMVGSPFGK